MLCSILNYDSYWSYDNRWTCRPRIGPTALGKLNRLLCFALLHRYVHTLLFSLSYGAELAISTQDSVEEKIVERAEAKLHLDALVIRQGQLVEKNKGMRTRVIAYEELNLFFFFKKLYQAWARMNCWG